MDELKIMNRLLSGERAAERAYEDAMDRIRERPEAIVPLKACMESHRDRADQLTREIRRRGGEADDDGSVWPGLADAIAQGAAALGAKPVLEALRLGERMGSRLYEEQASKLSGEAAAFVSDELLPQQRRTRELVEAMNGKGSPPKE